MVREIIKLCPFIQVIKLKAAIKYGQEDITGARSLLEISRSSEEDPDIIINQGSLFYKVSYIFNFSLES